MTRKRRIRSAVIATVIATSMVAAGDSVAGAGPAAEEEDDLTSDVFGQPLDQLLADYPDAERRADGAYELQPGMRLVPPGWSPSDSDADVGVMEAPSGCPDNYFCVYQHANFGGWGLHFYYCDTVWLNAPYDDNVSSVHNAQNAYWSYFLEFDPYPSRPDFRGLGPNSYLRNLAHDRAPDGGNWNDRIDQVDPC